MKEKELIRRQFLRKQVFISCSKLYPPLSKSIYSPQYQTYSCLCLQYLLMNHSREQIQLKSQPEKSKTTSRLDNVFYFAKSVMGITKYIHSLLEKVFIQGLTGFTLYNKNSCVICLLLVKSASHGKVLTVQQVDIP